MYHKTYHILFYRIANALILKLEPGQRLTSTNLKKIYLYKFLVLAKNKEIKFGTFNHGLCTYIPKWQHRFAIRLHIRNSNGLSFIFESHLYLYENMKTYIQNYFYQVMILCRREPKIIMSMLKFVFSVPLHQWSNWQKQYVVLS